ncbi:MAG: VanZ family protein [Saprospiraceae bacterium]
MKSFIPAIAWAIFILWASTSGGVNLPEPPLRLLEPDKIAHFGAYLVFGTLVLWAWHKKGLLDNKHKIYSVVGCALYGILMEIMQFSFFPGRYFEVNDIIANIIGSIGSLFLIRFFIT